MKTIRDSQRSKVYAWEQVHVAPHDQRVVPFDWIKSIVDYVWEKEGLKHPPLVEPMPVQKHALGDASRTTVRFVKETRTWIILHELAHSMSSTVENVEINQRFEGKTNVHGAIFMGIYIQLLTRYLNLNFGSLVSSAEAMGLRVDPLARPVFL
jgi:hypothetical protein